MMTSRLDSDIRPYEPTDPYQQYRYYNPVTITWGELRDGGFIDWTDERFAWDFYDDEQKARLEEMMDRRFWLREIAITPPEAWRLVFIEKLDEAMRVANLMYKALDTRENPLTESDEYHKSRSIGSDFPATLLNGSEGDYASDGRDYEYETIHDGNLMDAMAALDQFRHPDIYILDKLEGCFTNLISLDIDAF